MAALVPRVQARLALPVHRKVRGLLQGEYAAVHTGRGIELADLRPYVRGDDPKDLEPKASARSGELLVKRYVADRRHTALLVVPSGRDMAAHHRAGPAGTVAGATSKRDLAALVAGTVGWLAVRHGDAVALAHGDADGHHVLRPAGGEVHLERCLRAAHDATTPDAAPTDLLGLLSHVTRTVRRRTVLLLVCDEQDVTDGPALTAALRRLVAQHEVVVAGIGDLDPTDRRLGAPVRDLAAAGPLPAWVGRDPLLRREHEAATAARRRGLADAVAAAGAVHERVEHPDDAVRAVLRLLERHRRARRR